MRCDGFKDCFSCPFPDCVRSTQAVVGTVNVKAPKARGVIRVDSEGNRVRFSSVKEAAMVSKVDQGAISKCLSGRGNTAKGYVWLRA